MQRYCWLSLAIGLALAPCGTVQANPLPVIQPVVRLGDQAGGVSIKPGGHFEIGPLQDDGQLLFITEAAGGGKVLFRYANGTLTPLLSDGAKLSSGRHLEVDQVPPLRGDSPDALCRCTHGRRTPAFAPGQEMPGGGRLKAICEQAISTADRAGRHAFIATLEDGATAAYLTDAQGQLSLLLKSGTVTGRGCVTQIVAQGKGGSMGVGLNNRGQVALTLQIDRGPDTVVLLTPARP